MYIFAFGIENVSIVLSPKIADFIIHRVVECQIMQAIHFVDHAYL